MFPIALRRQMEMPCRCCFYIPGKATMAVPSGRPICLQIGQANLVKSREYFDNYATKRVDIGCSIAWFKIQDLWGCVTGRPRRRATRCS